MKLPFWIYHTEGAATCGGSDDPCVYHNVYPVIFGIKFKIFGYSYLTINPFHEIKVGPPPKIYE